ncbi:LuxR C-terminal-related transcriptional regulator [Kutzneria sp. NPDC051319]|uniref:LuxR C-terminal-related transcriptional regulator n=1 Tax=Kutzneria sp. NPDC051319 TaxID=3155047 RepID=UPI003425B679
MVSADTGHLVTLGLGERAASTYLALVSLGTSTSDELAAIVGHRPEQIRCSVEELLHVGLAGRAGPDREHLVAMPPGPALDLLTRRREAELAAARVAAADTYRALRRDAVEGLENLLEIIKGPAVQDRIRQLEQSVRAEVRGLDSPPYYTGADVNQTELDNLADGIRYRAVYAKTALERSEYLADNVVVCVKAGEEARTLPDVPVKLLIFDTDCALVSLADMDNGIGSALLIRPSSLLSALTGLFEVCWQAALPLALGEQGSGPFLQPSERRLLGLLAAGLGDEQVARALGISRRTLFRHLEGLMSRTGAANRFQLALHAKRNGWL